MTDYSPLQDAKDETGNPVTVDDMRDAGYDDFSAGDGAIDVQNHIVSALHALDGEVFDDPSKWVAVNELVGALEAMDEFCNMETTLQVEENGSTIEVIPKGNY